MLDMLYFVRLIIFLVYFLRHIDLSSLLQTYKPGFVQILRNAKIFPDKRSVVTNILQNLQKKTGKSLISDNPGQGVWGRGRPL